MSQAQTQSKLASSKLNGSHLNSGFVINDHIKMLNGDDVNEYQKQKMLHKSQAGQRKDMTLGQLMNAEGSRGHAQQQ